jgi:adenylate cyclase
MAVSALTTRKLLRGAAVGVGSALLALLISLTGILQGFEDRTWDWRVSLLARPGEATDQVAVILLDQESLDWASEVNGLPWPWPRVIYSYIIGFCQRAGVKALFFDVVFTEPSFFGVHDDGALASAISDIGVFVGTVVLSRENGEESWQPDAPAWEAEIRGFDAWRERGAFGGDYPYATFPIPQVAGSIRAAANVQMAGDADGVFRQGPLFSIFDGRAVPSPALASYAVSRSGNPVISLRPRRLLIDDTVVPVDGKGNTVFNYRGGSGTHANYTAAAVIQSEVQIQSGEEPNLDPSLLKDKYVFFGFSAPGLKDLRPTPVGSAYAGVEIHATMMDNLLSGDFIRKPPLGWSIAANILLVFAAGILASLASKTYQSVLLTVLLLPLPILMGLLAYFAKVWMPVMVLEVSVLLALIASNLINYFTEGRQKRYIKSAFSQYLSPVVIEDLISDPGRLKLGGERRELSIFFSDLQGFTRISEGLSPEALTALLNDYLSAMTDIILEEGGTIDKYEGDAIIAFWNAPVDQPDHAHRAVRSALRCQAKLAEMRPGIREEIGVGLFMRIGINSGAAVVGNMGSRSRFDYTMLGDAVNLAARLEGVNKQFGTYTMISANTYEKTRESFPARELSRIAVVGRAEPVTVYEPMSADDFTGRRKVLAAFEKGLARFYAGDFAEGERIFSALAPRDPASAAYRDKCRELASSPSTDWKGVWIMTEK